MITKERLEELIEQGATIWGVTDYTYHSSKPYKRIEYWDLGHMSTFYKNNIDEFFENNWNSEFFETKEEAEWHLKFSNITRTETVSLPSWEELNNDLKDCPDGEYVIVDDDKVTFTYHKLKEKSKLTIIESLDAIEFDATKENYIKACELAKKLFLGEEE